MLIYPHGLLNGERLGHCSDAAKLHFPRLAALANGFGRVKLSEREILETAYRDFRSKPTRDELMAWLREYTEHHLLLAYRADDGAMWGQWCGVPDNALPRYKTSADNRSPAPSGEVVAAFDEAYAIKKRERNASSEDSLNISERFGILPETSEDLGTFPRVVVVVEGEMLYAPALQAPLSHQTDDEKPKAPRRKKEADTATLSEVETVWAAYPLKKGKNKTVPTIERILANLKSSGTERPGELLVERIQRWEANREKARAEGRFVPEMPYPKKFFERGDWDDEDARPKPKAIFVEVSADRWIGSEGRL